MRISQKVSVVFIRILLGTMVFGLRGHLAITSHMFTRKPYVKSSGQVVAPIFKIEVLRFEREGGWVDRTGSC